MAYVQHRSFGCGLSCGGWHEAQSVTGHEPMFLTASELWTRLVVFQQSVQRTTFALRVIRYSIRATLGHLALLSHQTGTPI